MNEQSILQRLLNAQTALKTTIQKILDLNRQLKSLRKSKEAPENFAIKQELKLLNKVADQQAKIVRLYEVSLHRKVSN
jgi:LAS superfamily LD-carboxypeptidase LdcB